MITDNLKFPEGPVFLDSGDIALVELRGESITHIKRKTFEKTRYHVGGMPNGMVVKDENTLYFCDAGKVIAQNMYFPNGLTLLNKSNEIIIAESNTHRLVKGIWNPDAKTIENLQEFFPIGGIAEPDGLAIALDGNIYVAVFAAGKVWVFSTEGTLLEQINLPGYKPTNLIFDPFGELGLIVTEAERGELLSVTF